MMEEDGQQQEQPTPAQTPTTPPQHDTFTHSEDLTTKTLRFLSSASNETLGGIAVGLAACTYFVLGRVGLVLIGALGGVAFHAAWEGQATRNLAGIVENTRAEKGLDVMKRVLDWRDSRESTIADDDDAQELAITGRGFEGFQPETAIALNEFVDAVIRDYVQWWYSPILPTDQSFPTTCRQLFTNFLLSISSHLSRKRPADTFLDFTTNSTSIVIVFLNELSSAFSAASTSNTSAEIVNEYLVANPDSNLANVLNEKQQKKKFKMVADDILQNFLEKSSYSCEPANAFLREIMAGVILETCLKNCSKPEWINGWIVHLLEDGEPKIIHAIDVGMGSAPADEIDGNVGNVGLSKPKTSVDVERVRKNEVQKHKKRLSSAEEAMENAMAEAKRLSMLIAEEDAKKLHESQEAEDPKTPKNRSEFPTNGDVHMNGTSNGYHSDQYSPPSPTSTTKVPTSFDEIIPQKQLTALQSPNPAVLPLTLHNANIIIHDDSIASDKGKIRSKPTGDYLVQIEPESSHYPGWMIVRRYTDFESLHEVLRRIASISGVTAFTEQHSMLPNWKGHTKPSLRGELERYLRDACWYQPLAESEGMKRFLEKDNGHLQSPAFKTGFPGAIENMGKGMLDVMTAAPKGVAEGGKAILGGVTGVFGQIGNIGGPAQKKTPPTNPSGSHSAGRNSTSTLSRIDSVTSLSGSRWGRDSEDSLRVVSPPSVQTQPTKIAPMDRKPSYSSIAEVTNSDQKLSTRSERSSISGRGSTTHSRDPSRGPKVGLASPISTKEVEEVRLPPPPTDIPDDYTTDEFTFSRHSTSTILSSGSPNGRPSVSTSRRSSIMPTSVPKVRKESAPLSEQETSVAVELLFAVINELYTLSSAWNIRRTLLNAAKTFLLRPGNPSLTSIQSLIQDSIITSNTNDAGMASHLRKLRQNTMPTEAELAEWPAEMSPEEKENLRIKARKLLIERGVPAALTGVMGQAATGEALGRVFDCLQVTEVARGLMFGLLLQAVRAVTN